MFNVRKYHIFILIAVVMINWGCDPDDLPVVNMYGLESKTPIGNEKFLNNGSDFIFNQDSLYTYHLIIPEAAKNNIDAEPADEKYVPAILVFRGDTISPVAVRYKGSYGSFAGCVMGGNSSQISGEKICTKLSIKLDVTYYQDDYKFYNLNKLQFHSMNHDRTQMHERLGYWLFREMGVSAPRCVHVKLIINGEYSGLYALVEQVDEQFASFNFNDACGNMYKEVWPTSSKAKAYSERFYLNHLRTNQEIKSDKVLIREFGIDIENSDPADMNSVITQWMEIEKIISYAVVDRAIRADDGAFHWYEHNGRIYNHNYFWYEEPSKKKLYLIPYDLDNAFENIMQIENPITAIADEWGEINSNCETFEYASSGKKQRSAACDKLTGGWMAYEEEYKMARSRFINGIFSEADLTPLIESWSQQIIAATKEADLAHDDALNIFAWEAALLDLKEKLEFARN